ncbi:phytoene desaturase family protein [Corynebacterium pacaense]|uniref:phytoene desaturase family protein n=1 Tax=Corynebacterium pacaense TaxID=1816684 RepID=UPI0009B9F445|nr:phytoene desaturase family protein [Corynebacterium pacaense]
MSSRGQKPRKAVIIGAGIAGLATATLLARDGWSVEIVEKNSRVGGRAGSLEVAGHPGFRWDTGPSWYLMPEAFDHFFALCGTTTAEQLDLVDLQPGYRVYSGSRAPVDVPSGGPAAADLFESIEPGAGAALMEYLDAAGDAYGISVDRFLYNNFLRPGPLLHRDVLSRARRLAVLLSTSLQSYVNARFTDPLLRQILCYPAVFLSSSPDTTPAMYHLMSHTDLVEGVRYPRGGFDAVVRAIHRLAVDNGVSIRLSTEATSISAANGRTNGVTVRHDGTQMLIDADVVVSAADLHHTENHLLPKTERTYPERYWARRNPGIGCVLVMLGVKGRLPQFIHHNLLFSKDWDDDFAAVFDGPRETRPENASRSIYVSMPSASDPDVAPEGYENLFVLVPTAASAHLGHGNAYGARESPAVRAIADHVIEQISGQAGIADLKERIVVSRTVGPGDFEDLYHSWRGGALGPAHTLRQSAFLRGSNRSGKVDSLYYAGATTVPGVGVPMCLISAENVLKRLRGDTTPGPIGGDAQ